MVGVPFGVLAAEFAHFAREALPVQIGVFAQDFQIGAGHDFFAQLDDFLKHAFLGVIGICSEMVEQCHDMISFRFTTGNKKAFPTQGGRKCPDAL
ncbi:hypothetical protein D1872_310870 [compost metagenome]